jgi:hypothetical protein
LDGSLHSSSASPAADIWHQPPRKLIGGLERYRALMSADTYRPFSIFVFRFSGATFWWIEYGLQLLS